MTDSPKYEVGCSCGDCWWVLLMCGKRRLIVDAVD
jgi:hypothetical protein